MTTSYSRPIMAPPSRVRPILTASAPTIPRWRDADGSLAEWATGQFDHDVEVAQMSCVLVDQVEQDALQRRRLGALPTRARLTQRGQLLGLHNGGGVFAPRGDW